MNARKRRIRPAAKSFPQVMREFLTPQVFRQVRKIDTRRRRPRWDTHPLIWVTLLMVWSAGDSLPERFEVARGVYIACCPKRRRPGQSFSGFEKALGKLPMPLLRVLGAGLRTRIEQVFGDRLFCRGFIPLGCDGTRLECPRSEELEGRLGTVSRGGKLPDAPSVWNTSIVHLTLGIPWCWRFGRGSKASERKHLRQMIPLLPKQALIVADAGFVGYDITRALLDANVQFLIRMSCNATFFTEKKRDVNTWREGAVYLWPHRLQRSSGKPIRGRLIRVISRKQKDTVWLFTNVEDSDRLSVALASQFYRWRWENEGFFRTYKHTLKKLKLECRTVRLIHREAEVSMLATQLLLCQGAWAMPTPESANKRMLCSPRGVLLLIRAEFSRDEFRSNYSIRLSEARRDQRCRTSPKQRRRIFPGRRPHKPPEPPTILKLPDDLKPRFYKCLKAA